MAEIQYNMMNSSQIQDYTVDFFRQLYQVLRQYITAFRICLSFYFRVIFKKSNVVFSLTYNVDNFLAPRRRPADEKVLRLYVAIDQMPTVNVLDAVQLICE